MAYLFYDGFDHYKEYAGTTNHITIRAELVRGGWTMSNNVTEIEVPVSPSRFPDYAGKCARATSTTNNNLGKHDFVNFTDHTIGWALRRLQTVAAGNLLELWKDSNLEYIIVVTNIGKIAIYDADTALLETSVNTLDQSIWYYIEVSANASATGTITVNVDGVQWVQATSANTTNNTNFNGFRLGHNDSADYDDVYVSDSLTPIGCPRVITLFPETDDTPNDWTPSTGTDHAALVKEPSATDTTYLESATVAQQDEWTYDDLPSGAKTIFSASPQIRQQKQDAGTPKLKVYVDSGGTTPNSTGSLVATDSFTYIGDSYDLDGDGAGWTQAKVDLIKTKIEYESTS